MTAAIAVEGTVVGYVPVVFLASIVAAVLVSVAMIIISAFLKIPLYRFLKGLT